MRWRRKKGERRKRGEGGETFLNPTTSSTVTLSSTLSTDVAMAACYLDGNGGHDPGQVFGDEVAGGGCPGGAPPRWPGGDGMERGGRGGEQEGERESSE